MTESSSTGLLAGFGIMGIIIPIALCVLMLVSMWKIYEKAGEPGWATVIPVYNAYVLFKITWGNGILFLLMLIPVVNIVISLITTYKLAKVFGGGVVEFLLLLFVPVIIYPLLAFSEAEYVGIPEKEA